MKKLFITLLVLIIVGAGGAAAYIYTRKPVEPSVMTGNFSRGDVIQTVSATGTLEAVQTVLVGTQVTGIVKELHADFNRIVHKGQLLARLDRTNFEAALQQQQAALQSRYTDLDRQRVSLDDSRVKLKRSQDLFAKNLVTQQDLEAAQLSVKTLEMQIKSAESSIVQQQATVNQAQINLDYTDIYAPLTGIVIDRKVDVGQTVVSNQSASVIFNIAADLTKMQARASVDESDVALIRPGQRVTFRVDAYQNREFIGSVSQVRLQPVVSQNVVTYITIVDIPNPDYSLKPGMTTNVKIEIARRQNVLRIPNGALRFRPTQEIFEAFNQEMPPELQRGGRGGAGAMGGMGRGMAQGGTGATGGTGAQGDARQGGPRATETATPGQPGTDTRRPRGGADEGTGQRAGAAQGADQRGGGQGARDNASRMAGGVGGRGDQGGAMDPERMKRFQERMKDMTPEQREAMTARFQGGARGNSSGGRGDVAGARQGRGQEAPAAESRLAGTDTSQTIDALFAPLQFNVTSGRVWLFVDKKLKSVSLRLGITDGTYTEVIGEPEGLQTGQALVTAVNLPQTSSTPAMGGSPLTPQRGGMPGGGFGGGRAGGGGPGH